MSTSTLCRYCQALILSGHEPGFEEIEDADGELTIGDKDILIDYERHDTYPDFPALQATAVGGCEFCALLLKVIKREYQTHILKYIVDPARCHSVLVRSLWYKREEGTLETFSGCSPFERSSHKGSWMLQALLEIDKDALGNKNRCLRHLLDFDACAEPGNMSATA